MGEIKKCAICRTGAIRPGFTTVTLERGESVVVVRNVPALVCDHCGEFFLDEATSKSVLDRAAGVAASGAEVGVLMYSA